MAEKQKTDSKASAEAKQIMQEKNEKEQAKKYNQYVENKTPQPNLLKDMGGAFLVGGGICTLGQVLMGVYQNLGAKEEDAATYVTLSLVLFSVILTGFGLFQKLTKFGGAGALVPITGFANSVASPAIEFGVEGQVYGIGCKIFTIAGPVILFGIATSSVLGLLYWVGTMMGVAG